MEVGLSIVLIFIGLVCTVGAGCFLQNNEIGNGVLLFIVGLSILCIPVFCAIDTAKNYGYKEGQVDAINHKIYYKLVTKTDSTKVWEQKK